MNDRPHYPWKEGDELFASELNAAISNGPYLNLGGTNNVRFFGAMGDGVTDDTAAIQAAFAAVPASGGDVFFPAGNYLISHTLFISSNTRVTGAGAGTLITAAVAWTVIPGPSISRMMFTNVNWNAGTISDHDISIENMQFTFVNQTTSGASGLYAINLWKVSGVTIRDCIFHHGDDGTYLLGCDNALIEGCSAYDFANCAFDASFGPRHHRVVNCYAKTGVGAQFVNFNALGGGTLPLGQTADGLIVEGCQFICTASSAAINFSTLGEAESCRNVVIANNTLSGGAWIYGQGDIQNVVINGNVIVGSPSSGLGSIMIFQFGAAPEPANISVTNNVFVGPQTTEDFVGVIRVQANGYHISGNTVTGNAFFSAIGTGANAGVVGVNSFSTGTGPIQEGTASFSQTTDYRLRPGDGIRWFDSAASPDSLPGFIAFGDTWQFYNTDASGLLYPIFGTTFHRTGEALHVYAPLTFGSTLANFGFCQGAPAGQSPTVSAAGTDTNIALRLVGKGNGGVFTQAMSITGPPTAASIPGGYFTVAPDGAGGVRLYCNAGGVLKSVALT